MSTATFRPPKTSRRPPVKDFAEDGFPLVGGRLDVLGGRNVQTSANQGKTVLRKVFHRRREVQLAVEPRFHGVLIGRRNVGEVPGLQRADMRVDEFRCGEGRSSRVPRSGPRSRPGIPRDRRDQNNRGGHGCPPPQGDPLRDRNRSRRVQFRPDLLAQRMRSAFTKTAALKNRTRSEERRVGKECRYRWWADDQKKNGR